jgi:hypothetical protein
MQDDGRRDRSKTREEIEERKSDATSKETLDDLENREEISDSKSEDEESQLPSPDASIDEGRKKSDDAGPM